MKKLPFFFFLVLLPLFMWAQDDNFAAKIWGDEPEAPEKPPFRFRNRMVELSLATTNINVSNDAISIKDYFRNPIAMGRTNKVFKNHLDFDVDDF
jgi:hypothetical protein